MAVKRDMYNMVTRWHHEQVAYFLGRLKNTDDGGGKSLLDNSTVLYGSNLADGHEHAAKSLPLLVAGRGGGRFKSGQLVRFRRDQTMSNLHLSLLQSVGVQTDRFADSSGPMVELEQG